MPIPFIAGALIKLAISQGGNVLRALGKKKGGVAETVANTIADVADGVSKAPPAVQEEALSSAISALPPEQLVVAMEMNADAQARMVEAREETARDMEETHRERLRSDDSKVRQTRPMIARQSWFAALGYALGSVFLQPLFNIIGWGVSAEAIPAVGLGTFSWEVFIALASPAFAFMGIRGVERIKAGGTASK